MTYAISVPTPFTDISELAENFYQRVDEQRLMLPNEDAIPEGEWIEFHVTLADGTAALQGHGRCAGSIDNGEDRAPEHRFDVVMDELRLDDLGQVYFERILQVRAAYAGDEPQTGEIGVGDEYAEAGYEGEALEAAEAVEDVAAEDEVADAFAYAVEDTPAYEEPPAYEPRAYDEAPPAYEAAPAYAEPAAADAALDEALDELDSGLVEADEWEEPSGATEVGAIEDYLPRAAAPAAPAVTLAAPGESRIYELPPPVTPSPLPSPHSETAVLTRPVLHASWSPEPLPRFDASPSSGHFQYARGAGLPQPAEPPRPALDPSLVITRAPRLGDPHAGAIFAEAYADEDEDAGEYAADDGEAQYAAAPAFAEPPAAEPPQEWDAEEEGAYDEYEDEESTYDAEGYAGVPEETRQVDLGGLPDYGEETMQVEIPEE
ncbi:MAG: hypothetical protein KF729_13515 [Sandaracinaceae bacterium]|nr:hypothetical protein [Sandaracinaceae bacterium]